MPRRDPQSVGGRCLQDVFADSQLPAQGVNLGLVEVRDGAQIDNAVTVLGVEADAEILHLVTGTEHQTVVLRSEVVEGGHAQAGTAVNHGHVPGGLVL